MISIDLIQSTAEVLMVLHDADDAAVAARIEAELRAPRGEGDIREAIEQMAQSTIAERSMHYSDFARVMELIGMEFDELYRHYVGKNVLNFFRQDHGYKEGTYVKLWDGREDNEHLAELLAVLDSDSADFRDRVYEGLRERYPG